MAVTSHIITLNPTEWEIQSSEGNSLNKGKKGNLRLHQLHANNSNLKIKGRLMFRSQKGWFEWYEGPQVCKVTEHLDIFSTWMSAQVPTTWQFSDNSSHYSETHHITQRNSGVHKGVIF